MKGFLLAAVLVLAGCGAREAQVVGRWKGDVKLTKEEQEMPLSNLKTGLASSVSIEVKPDHTFQMTAVFVPIEGTWALTGNQVTFTPKEVFGFKTGKSGSSDGTMKADAEGGKPFTLALSGDGQRLEAVGDVKQSGEYSFVKEDA